MSVRDLIILGSSSQQPTRYRNHGAYLLRWNEEGMLFDPGEGTQRQFIFANVSPTTVTRIFISHFHGDHCLGLGSMIMRLNLDRVKHPIHCYYPASGKKYFDRLRYSTIYHETVNIIEHPINEEGLIHNDGNFSIEAFFLDHGIDCVGWRITEPERRKFDNTKLLAHSIKGPAVRKLLQEKRLFVDGKTVFLDDVSAINKGDTFAMISDTKICKNTASVAKGAKMLLCESTYLERDRDLAFKNYHMTAKDASTIAKDAGCKYLILTHFSARYRDMKEFEKESQKIFPNTQIANDFNYFPFPR